MNCMIVLDDAFTNLKLCFRIVIFSYLWKKTQNNSKFNIDSVQISRDTFKENAEWYLHSYQIIYFYEITVKLSSWIHYIWKSKSAKQNQLTRGIRKCTDVLFKIIEIDWMISSWKMTLYYHIVLNESIVY